MNIKVTHTYENVDNREKYHMDWVTHSSSHPPAVPSTAATEKAPSLFPDFLQPGMQQTRRSQQDGLSEIWKVK